VPNSCVRTCGRWPMVVYKDNVLWYHHTSFVGAKEYIIVLSGPSWEWGRAKKCQYHVTEVSFIVWCCRLHILVCDTSSSGLEYKIHDTNSKMKVKLSLYTPWRHSSFGTLAPCGSQTSNTGCFTSRGELHCPLNRRLVGSHRLSWCFGEDKNLLGFLWDKPLDRSLMRLEDNIRMDCEMIS
jgi:hypothetical protein